MPAIVLLEQPSNQFLFGDSWTIASVIVWTGASKLMALHQVYCLFVFFLMTIVQVVSGKDACFVPGRHMLSYCLFLVPQHVSSFVVVMACVAETFSIEGC